MCTLAAPGPTTASGAGATMSMRPSPRADLAPTAAEVATASVSARASARWRPGVHHDGAVESAAAS